jgi:hypothetical protein
MQRLFTGRGFLQIQIMCTAAGQPGPALSVPFLQACFLTLGFVNKGHAHSPSVSICVYLC